MQRARRFGGQLALVALMAMLVAACGSGASSSTATAATSAVATTTAATPALTSTPTVVVVASPTTPPATAAEQAYADYLAGQIRMLITTMTAAATDVQQPLTSLDALSDSGWQATIRTDVANWHQTHLDAQTKTPPASLAAANAPFLSGLGNLDQCSRDVTTVLADGGTNGMTDLGLLLKCKNSIQLAKADLSGAQRDLDFWQSDHAPAQP